MYVGRGSSFVSPEDVYEVAQGCEWLIKGAADTGSQEAQYSLGGCYLARAAALGHIPSQWSVFQRDPSRLAYLDNCARSHHRPALLRKAELSSPAVGIPLLVELQTYGSDEESDNLFELKDHLSPEAALSQARFGRLAIQAKFWIAIGWRAHMTSLCTDRY
jgi:hypothetical protein